MTVAHLRRPSVRFRASFLVAVDEFRAEDVSDRNRSDQDLSAEAMSSVEGFREYVRALTAEAQDQTRLAPGIVPSTRLWWTQGETFLGRIDVRHRLTPALLQVGGHVGYAVRPSARRRGHATAMLGEALVIARSRGLERVLVTCDADNVASRRVIEANHGELEDQRGTKLRFWIDT